MYYLDMYIILTIIYYLDMDITIMYYLDMVYGYNYYVLSRYGLWI